MKRYLDLGNGYAALAAEFTEMENFQVARIGNWDGTKIESDDARLYVRLWNGNILEAVNDAQVPAILDFMVIIGKEKALLGKYHILYIYIEWQKKHENKTS